MWTEEVKNKKLAIYDKGAPGGTIRLYITRLTIASANTEYFTVIVKDSNEVEVYRKDLTKDTPEVPNGDSYWWNTTSIWLPSKIEGSFFIYVIDKLSDDNGKFKFSVMR